MEGKKAEVHTSSSGVRYIDANEYLASEKAGDMLKRIAGLNITILSRAGRPGKLAQIRGKRKAHVL